MKIFLCSFLLILELFGQDLPQPIRVSNCVGTLPFLLKQVPPEYPPIAKAARLQGVVMFEAVVTKKGTIDKKSVRLMSTDIHPILVKAAQDAFVQWQYKPLLLNGKPVTVPVYAEIKFMLGSTAVE